MTKDSVRHSVKIILQLSINIANCNEFRKLKLKYTRHAVITKMNTEKDGYYVIAWKLKWPIMLIEITVLFCTSPFRSFPLLRKNIVIIVNTFIRWHRWKTCVNFLIVQWIFTSSLDYTRMQFLILCAFFTECYNIDLFEFLLLLYSFV